MKNILQEFKNSEITIINEEILEHYIYFCTSNNLKTKQKNSSHHHILPKKIFPQYGDLRKSKWNGVHLSYENHYKAHSILVEAVNNPAVIGAWWGMNNKDKITKGTDGLKILGTAKYAELFKKAVEETSRRNSGLVLCRLKTSPEETIKVTVKEYKKNRELYLSNTEGKLSVIEKSTGVKIFIDKENYNKNIHIFHKTGIKRKQSSIDKEKATKAVIQENGKTLAYNSVMKGQETLKKKYGDNYEKYISERNSFKKDKHGKALKINICDSENNIVYTCNGDIKYIIEENKLPITLIKSYREKRKLGDTPRAKTFLINKGYEKYIGWYAEIIK